ncbi:ABC transporter substrate-binding protein [Yaniella halotolerans]|uniref:ABC transporter substrate-binding protein n=1 Tax=Yaniella halotolerans TaxID=225453 RepID=UPI0003B34DC0|nr:ABC transporter substrate-binding protein [Yaniella halotolerans]
MLSNKRITLSASMLIGALALASCGSVASSSRDQNSAGGTESTQAWEAPDGLSGEISYYSANPQGLTDDLVAAFEEKTDVKVNVYADTTGKITARLKAEEANPQADLVYMASWDAATEQSSAGTLAPYSPEGSDQVHEGWSTDEFIGRDGSALALVVNTNATDAMPSDWSDLADQEYKDQVIMPDPRESGTAADLITAMVAQQGEEETWKLFDNLFENGMVVQGANGPALDTVTAGSKAVVFGGVDYSAYSAKDEGEALEVVIPESGTTVTPRPLMILESSDNAEAAQAFADFMFSAQGQEVSAQRNMIPGREDVPAQAGPQFEEIDQLATDWNEIVESSEGVTDEFVQRYLN